MLVEDGGTYPLHGCRDGDYFLNGVTQSLNVVLPVQDLMQYNSMYKKC